jgi:hypothetical protein
VLIYAPKKVFPLADRKGVVFQDEHIKDMDKCSSLVDIERSLERSIQLVIRSS